MRTFAQYGFVAATGIALGTSLVLGQAKPGSTAGGSAAQPAQPASPTGGATPATPAKPQPASPSPVQKPPGKTGVNQTIPSPTPPMTQTTYPQPLPVPGTQTQPTTIIGPGPMVPVVPKDPSTVPTTWPVIFTQPARQPDVRMNK